MINYYQHDFESVEQYLHHRPPYLMVDRIAAIEATSVQTEKLVSTKDYFMAGHFPGAPIFPGAMMQELTTQSAGILIAARYNPMPEYNTADPFFNEYALGVLVRVKWAKFLGFARPGDLLSANVDLKENLGNVFDFSARICIGPKTIMRNAFQLTNVPSRLLQSGAEGTQSESASR